ncbi:MAG: acyl-CoA/acyl-ACP dehydrogenase [bacterium]|nr:acyl-CoA/acyl-ACP dehydrogenase [bacterium]
MNFDFSDDQKLLQQTARDFLEQQESLVLCREVLESDQLYARDLWKSAGELGWLGAVIPEEYGGAGFGYLELAVLAEEVGRGLAPIPFSSSVYLATEALLLAGSPEQKKRYLPRLAAGEIIGTAAFTEQPGQNPSQLAETRFADGRLDGVKLPVPDGAAADFAVLTASTAEGLSLVIAELDAEAVEKKPLSCFDESRPQVQLRFEHAAAEPLGPAGMGGELMERLLDRAAVLTAFEQLGAASRAFELTREFALERYAFGRPVASFQAIKHRLADLWCQVELARSNCYYGAWALSNDAPELGVAACIARIAASRALTLASEEMIQIHGGVGYTWEYDCHLFYRRAKLLSLALGNPSSWKQQLIDRLQDQSRAA